MNEEVLQLIQQKIYDFSGIKIADSQKAGLEKLIQELSFKAGLRIQDFVNKITPENPDFNALINYVTVNETYFFREEKQFDFLRTVIFPKFMGKQMNIWSAAGSTGEEAISLLILALSCNVNVQVFVSDIDESALQKLKSGVYGAYSFRPDGKKYHDLLEPYYVKDGDKVIFRKNLLERLHICKYNLTDSYGLPFEQKMDLIFLRNVFIYFSQDTRKKIAEGICRALSPEGSLFFSMNEIASIDTSIIPSVLEKTNWGPVYYFTKTDGNMNNKAVKTPTVSTKRTAQMENYLKELKKNLGQKADQLNSKKEFLKKNHKTESALVGNQKSSLFTVEKPNITEKTKVNKQEFFNKVSGEINKRDFESGKKIVEELKDKDIKDFYYFLHGYIEYHADNKEIAENFFSSSEILNSNFWPSCFYHGMLLKDIGKTEKAEFYLKKCMELLDKNQNVDELKLDDFSPKYIYSLCEKMLKV